MMNHPASNFVVRLRGLPYSTNQNEIRNFLQGCQIRQIHLLTKEQGRPTGECFVITETKDDVELAKTFDKKLMSNRYIEVFESNPHDMAQMMKNSSSNDASYAPTNSSSDNFWNEPVVRLRGLPYNATKEDVINFFAGLDIAQNGVHISSSKPAGEAFVAFMNMDNAHRALGFNRKNIGHRYIEIFKSNYGDARASILNDTQASLKQKTNYNDPRSNNYPPNESNHAPPAPPSHFGYDYRNTNQYVPSMPPQSQSQSLTSPPTYYNQYESAPNNYSSQPPPVQGSQKRHMTTSFIIKMRGVPYDAMEKDIFEFFKPVVPIQLDQEAPGRGRPPAWYAEFGSREEATDAMTFDKQYMGSRYVELFPLYDELYPSKTMRA